MPSRNPPDRHTITYVKVYVVPGGTAYTQALCSCNRYESPAYWSRQRAEEAAHDHVTAFRYGKKGVT